MANRPVQNDVRGDDSLRRLVERRREERPGLPEQHREGDRERRVEADLDPREERLGDAEGDERRTRRKQILEPLDQVLVERVGDRERRARAPPGR